MEVKRLPWTLNSGPTLLQYEHCHVLFGGVKHVTGMNVGTKVCQYHIYTNKETPPHCK